MPVLEEAIDVWNGNDSTLHARALARLGMSLFFGADHVRRWTFLDAALEMARRVGEP